MTRRHERLRPIVAIVATVKGDVMLKFMMPGLGADAMKMNFVPLARKALARL